MGTQLILTVGTNPLPVWVAWYHLNDKLPQPIKVQLVHTVGTVDERNRLKKYCQDADFLDPIQTSDGDPCNVRNDIRNIANGLSDETTLLHIHYTGGTKVMAVETVAALETTLQETIRLDTSYLDPRATSGPAIVNRAGSTWVQDTRKGVSPDLNRIALLNGFTLGPFKHRYWDKETGRNETENCPAPATPSQEQLEAGVAVLAVACNKDKDFRDLFLDRISKWNEIFLSQYRKFSYPRQGGTFRFSDSTNTIWQNKILPALDRAYPHCTWDTKTGTLSYPSYLNASDNQQSDLEQVHKFFNGIWLEYGAYVAFKDALEKISTNNLDRNNYKLFHSVHARRAKATDQRVKHFELDVVAVLGYQIVVVSCTVDRSHDRIKQKGMEAILRARQLGGDEARAIVLCSAHQNDAKLIEDELMDEMGSASEPLQVWGRNRWRGLSNKFYQYLRNDLHWM